MREILLNILNNSELLEILKKHLSEALQKNVGIEVRFETSKKSLISPQFILPILGVQGSGKSSLLNAILFDDIILPIDADETTCIPTEIRYGNNKTPTAEVYYKDGKNEKIDLSEEGLKPFVHQSDNPNNKKKVDYILITLQNTFLKSGLVLVDLPGVGSITKGNISRTIDYIKKSNGAIFLIRTVPPITRSESVFIQGTWPLTINTFFIQNQWMDENKEEVEDGLNHNLKVLKKIAKDCLIPDVNINIDIINVQKALIAKIKNNTDFLIDSGLTQFTKKLQNFSDNLQNKLFEQIKDGIIEIINKCLEEINYRITFCKKSKEEILNQLEIKKKNYLNELDRKKEIFLDVFESMNTQKSEIKKRIKEECKIASENLRNNIREIINSGVTGGDHLNRAYRDCLKVQLDNIFEQIQPLIINMDQQIKKEIDETSNSNFSKIQIKQSSNFDEQTKITSLYSPIASAGGGIGAMVAAGFAMGSIFPVAGNITGAITGAIAGLVAGVLGGLLGSKLGNAAKEFHLDKQKEHARKQLFELIDEFKRNTINEYNCYLENFCDDLKNAVDLWMIAQKDEYLERENKIKADFKRNEDEKKSILAMLNKDEEYLRKILETLKVE